MIQILEAVVKEKNLELQNKLNAFKSTKEEGDLHVCLEMDPIRYDAASSDDSDKSEMEPSACPSQSETVNNCFVNDFTSNDQNHTRSKFCENSKSLELSCCSSKVVNGQKSLEGLRILLAEDTPVLQRVATIMLQKLGASVVVVGDGMQAVDALYALENDYARNETKIGECPSYDLILMDCQMPKMDGYEATKAIRKSEMESGSHIPIVALTAHAMSSDEAKCLEVGMDAYLTKPIDCKLMVSTILSLTRRTA